jgi:hypothetical protein
VRAVIGTARYWLPLVGAAVCLLVASLVGTVLGLILLVAAFGLVLDGATALWVRAGGTGNVTTHKQ